MASTVHSIRIICLSHYIELLFKDSLELPVAVNNCDFSDKHSGCSLKRDYFPRKKHQVSICGL